eukprot:Hpha_TRINITY_DN16299_c1_g4::TRINITY_DN16299_c1_g4_i3::g.14719::m.14719
MREGGGRERLRDPKGLGVKRLLCLGQVVGSAAHFIPQESGLDLSIGLRDGLGPREEGRLLGLGLLDIVGAFVLLAHVVDLGGSAEQTAAHSPGVPVPARALVAPPGRPPGEQLVVEQAVPAALRLHRGGGCARVVLVLAPLDGREVVGVDVTVTVEQVLGAAPAGKDQHDTLDDERGNAQQRHTGDEGLQHLDEGEDAHSAHVRNLDAHTVELHGGLLPGLPLLLRESALPLRTTDPLRLVRVVESVAGGLTEDDRNDDHHTVVTVRVVAAEVVRAVEPGVAVRVFLDAEGLEQLPNGEDVAPATLARVVAGALLVLLRLVGRTTALVGFDGGVLGVGEVSNAEVHEVITILLLHRGVADVVGAGVAGGLADVADAHGVNAVLDHKQDLFGGGSVVALRALRAGRKGSAAVVVDVKTARRRHVTVLSHRHPRRDQSRELLRVRDRHVDRVPRNARQPGPVSVRHSIRGVPERMAAGRGRRCVVRVAAVREHVGGRGRKGVPVGTQGRDPGNTRRCLLLGVPLVVPQLDDRNVQENQDGD